jgi:glycerophosphoryl diester phosphodiesterase
VHVSKDDVVLMFHDPALGRTTDFKGNIRDLDWYGEKGMMNARTVKGPKQAIPTFKETIDLLMKVRFTRLCASHPRLTGMRLISPRTWLLNST